MAELGERVAWVEGKIEEQTMRVDDVREAVGSLEGRMDRRFEGVDRRFEGVDRRFESLERRFDALDRKIDSHFKVMLAAIVGSFGTLAGLILRH